MGSAHRGCLGRVGGGTRDRPTCHKHTDTLQGYPQGCGKGGGYPPPKTPHLSQIYGQTFSGSGLTVDKVLALLKFTTLPYNISSNEHALGHVRTRLDSALAAWRFEFVRRKTKTRPDF
eukprot:scaffold74358_cov50-Phaeocystis_antarctica.AAC.1